MKKLNYTLVKNIFAETNQIVLIEKPLKIKQIYPKLTSTTPRAPHRIFFLVMGKEHDGDDKGCRGQPRRLKWHNNIFLK